MHLIRLWLQLNPWIEFQVGNRSSDFKQMSLIVQNNCTCFMIAVLQSADTLGKGWLLLVIRPVNVPDPTDRKTGALVSRLL